MEENIKEVLNRINRYQIIYENNGKDLNKLNKYDYNTEIIGKQEISNNNVGSDKNNNEMVPNNKNKSKNMKNKYKNLMKKKNNIFMDKVSSSNEMLKIITEENKENKNKDNKNEILCFYCRNPIDMNSFDVPYGKLGLLIDDYFYSNSIKSTIKNELSTLFANDNEKKNDIYEKIIKNIINEKFNRITSCGHYFHTSCFYKGIKRENNNNIIIYHGDFTCPLCLKNQNILIPPLNQIKQKYSILKSAKIDEILNKNNNSSNEDIDIVDSSILFKDNIIKNFLLMNFLIDIINKDYKDFISYLNDIYPQYKAEFNYFENIFYINGTLFHKHQIIDTLQNIHLSLRVSLKKVNNNSIKFEQLMKYVMNELI